MIFNWTVPPTNIIENMVSEPIRFCCVPVGTLAAYEAALGYESWESSNGFLIEIKPATFTYNDINFTVTSPTTVEVGANFGFNGDAVIPSNVTNGNIVYEVTSIGNYAFYKCAGLTSIKTPMSVLNVGFGAFIYCVGLKTIDFSNSITIIASHAFLYCNSLILLKVPNSVTNIGDYAFGGCANLKSVIIPNSVKSIGEYAFGSLDSLLSVTVNWLTPLALKSYTFSKFTGLTTATLYVPAGTSAAYQTAPVWQDFGTIIEMQPITFTYQGINFKVTSPTTVEVATNPNFIGDAVIPSSVSNAGVVYDVTAIGERAFWQCTGLTSVNIPNSIVSIYYQAFGNCENLTSLKIPNSVTFIGILAFADCTRISSLSISNSLTNIETQAFAGCQGLTSLSIPNSVTNIGEGVFRVCTSLKTLILPSSVTSIYYYVFEDCSNLTSVTVNWATPLVINANVFNGVPLASATLYVPAGTLAAYQAAPVWQDFGTIIEMQPITFTYQGINFKVTSPTTIEITATPSFTGVLTIPSSITYEGITYDVTSIANNAFAGSGITTINIPSTISNIGDYAFANLTGLTAVTVNWTTPLVINANVFGDVPIVIGKMREPSKIILANTNISSATLYVPVGTLAAYQAALVWKNFGNILEQTTLPLTLTSLTAKVIPTGNQINWATANVVNVRSIIIERSGADKIFISIASLPATASQFIDNNPLAGDNYYRLSTIDNDGSPVTYPQIAFVKGLTNDVSFYPNPVTNGLLNVVAGTAKIHSVALFNLNGKKVVLVNTKNSSNKIAVSTQGLVKGVYVLEISSEKGKTIKKVVVN